MEIKDKETMGSHFIYILTLCNHTVCMFYVSPGFFTLFGLLTIWTYICIIICASVFELKN